MIVTGDKHDDTRPPSPRRAGEPVDPWEDWKPQWTSKSSSVHLRQETHSPTEDVAIRMTGDRTVYRGKRRIVDARLWEQMTQEQQDAALEIALAFETMGRGLGYATSDWTKIPGARGASNPAEFHGWLIRDYIDWTKLCHAGGVSHSMVVDVLCFGFGCKMLDRDRRCASGTTRKNLMDGLTLYCEMKGWTGKRLY